MKNIEITISGEPIDQKQAQMMAQIVAEGENPESFVISRFSKPDNACSPCCLKSDLGGKPGWEVYGENHGGRIKISVNNGDYVFICT